MFIADILKEFKILNCANLVKKLFWQRLVKLRLFKYVLQRPEGVHILKPPLGPELRHGKLLDYEDFNTHKTFKIFT